MTGSPEINATMVKFGYPETLVKEYSKWMVQVRAAQVTLGSLVMACKDPATAFSDQRRGLTPGLVLPEN